MANDVDESAIPLTEIVVAVDLDGVTHQLCTVGEAARFLTTATQYVPDSSQYREARKSLEQAAADAFYVRHALKSLRIFLGKERLLVP